MNASELTPPAPGGLGAALPEVESDMQRLERRLAASNHPLPKLPMTLAPFLGTKAVRGVTSTFSDVMAQLNPYDAIRVAAVLAHDTAFRELGPVLRVVDVFAAHFKVSLTVLLTRWERLRRPVGDEAFRTISDGIRSQLDFRGNISTDLLVLDRDAIKTSAPFVQAREEIWSPAEGTPCAEDLKWLIAFYGRQRSYRPEGVGQAYEDLAMRRGIGLQITELDPDFAILTEMTDRLALCARCSCPALNARVSH